MGVEISTTESARRCRPQHGAKEHWIRPQLDRLEVIKQAMGHEACISGDEAREERRGKEIRGWLSQTNIICEYYKFDVGEVTFGVFDIVVLAVLCCCVACYVLTRCIILPHLGLPHTERVKQDWFMITLVQPSHRGHSKHLRLVLISFSFRFCVLLFTNHNLVLLFIVARVKR